MKITIDTKEDSPEEIKKVIRMLSNLVGTASSEKHTDIFSSDSTQETESNLMGMFDNSQETAESQEEPEEEKKEDIGVEVIEFD